MNNRVMRIVKVVAIGLFASFLLRCEAKGIKASPAEIILQDVVPGEFYDLYKVAKVKITIYNDDENQQSFKIGCFRSYVVGKIMKGYTEIPDTKWVSFDRNEISIPANGKSYVNVSLKIPKQDKYYNQNWCCYIGILTRPESGLSLGLYIRMRIETKERDKISERPYGKVAVVPSKIIFRNEKEKRIKIYNNTDRKIKLKIQPVKDIKEVRRYISSGYKVFPEKCFFQFQKQIEIPAEGKKEVVLKLNCGNERKEGKYEKVFFVEGDGETFFFRVREENEK